LLVALPLLSQTQQVPPLQPQLLLMLLLLPLLPPLLLLSLSL